MSYPKRYIPKSLSKGDRAKQKRELNKSRRAYRAKRGKGRYHSRDKMKSFKSKKSGWTKKFHDKYPEAKTYTQISRATGIPAAALKAVVRKGMGAYYSSGSRPNQTAESWGKARMYSYILGGPTRKIDKEITKRYGVKF